MKQFALFLCEDIDVILSVGKVRESLPFIMVFCSGLA